MFIIIAPLASFVSDHALAAMFLPIGILLYQNSLTNEVSEDTELAKMLMITIAMACNIGGFGAPSGGARNVIMMTYLNDMFGFDIGYFQWVSYAMPFVICMIPITWFVTCRRFKPKIYSLAPAMDQLRYEIGKMGGWSRQQIIALVIFAGDGFWLVHGKNILRHGHHSSTPGYRRDRRCRCCGLFAVRRGELA